MDGKNEIVRLNANISKELKTRVKVYCVENDLDIKEFVALALESLLEEMEGEKAV